MTTEQFENLFLGSGSDLRIDKDTLASIFDALNKNNKPPVDAYTQPDYTSVVNPTINDVDGLAKRLGVNFTYDRGEIEKIYQDATRAAMKAARNDDAEREYISHLAKSQQSANDLIRKQYADAVSSGASRGMQAASMLSTILGVTQAATDEATQIAKTKQQQADQYAAKLKQDAADALRYSNDVAQNIGSLSHSLYNDQIQQLAAQLGYNQAINTDRAGYLANKYTADSNAAANTIATGAGIYNNRLSVLAQIQSALEEKEAQKYAADKGQYQKLEYAGGYTAK
jgi:hypothetical protein